MSLRTPFYLVFTPIPSFYCNYLARKHLFPARVGRTNSNSVSAGASSALPLLPLPHAPSFLVRADEMRPKIVLFGDSITEGSFDNGGWGAALASHFSRTADVVLRGYSGCNSRWAVEVVERVFRLADKEAAAAPLAVTVFFGANDACLADRSSAFQHVPLNEYKHNLQAIISFIKKQWATTLILLITPPPIDEEGRLQHPFGDNHDGLPERTNESAGAYAKACISVANESGFPVVDLWSKMQQFPGWEKAFLRDGLHLTPSGNRIVFEEVVEALKREGISPVILPADVPLLHEMDPLDPPQMFQEVNCHLDT